LENRAFDLPARVFAYRSQIKNEFWTGDNSQLGSSTRCQNTIESHRVMKDHRIIDERSRAFGEALAVHIRENPELVLRAKETLLRWMQTCSDRSKSTLSEWLEILNGPLDGVLWVLTSTDQRATRLRSSNPFAGVLPNDERVRILREFQSRDTTPT
jgi:hypothetical protein